ncbi:RidA family protein [Variovorax arabinosiphilus]|uniref:RidA family protein n=1 Tax=Variovorax arabinosiphilus TaxID=3053498 RepID=UPI002575B2D1|nr:MULTISPECIES: RidA family protein [unclassified Variovorax]MDM0123376.1 RidA family protein [Variovorax sp. J2L1-78]MDM0132435.1 RidA family protein [Variovorax sp. J2L1-63]MDM0231032.1 RidA family protein [Variovorax sp. J2R1-6]
MTTPTPTTESTPRDIVRLDQNARRSRAVIAGGMVYLAGQVADDKTLDIGGQTRQVLQKIDDLLAQAGTTRDRLVTAQIWLASMSDFAGLNAVWDAWVVPGETPTRCCGKVELADPDFRVEIVATALLP